MRTQPPARVKLIKKAEKEAALVAFIVDELKRLEAHETDQVCPAYTLVVRSQNSPAARALATVADQLTAADVTIRVIFATSETNSDPDIESPAQVLTEIGQCRILDDLRFVDAHEQLVLGPSCAWIGDCMRREPTRRDAFENFAPDCSETALFAANGFERLWAAATPIKRKRASRAALADAKVVVAERETQGKSASSSKPVAGTRH